MSDSSQIMHVKIYAPFRTYFDGDARSVSAENGTGPFDVLPRHKNFMTLLVPCTVVVRANNKPDFRMQVSRAVMHVKSNMTTIFLDV